MSEKKTVQKKTNGKKADEMPAGKKPEKKTARNKTDGKKAAKTTTKYRKKVIVSSCGLVCTECGAYKKMKCKGCRTDHPMFRDCPIKNCNEEREQTTCAECKDFPNPSKCKKLNNMLSRVFGLIFRTNRVANVRKIRKVGLETFTEDQR